MTIENQQFIYDNLDNPAYEDVEECLKETDIEALEKDIRSDIDRVAGAFMDYMTYANKEEIPMDVADALWALVEQGLAFKFADRHKPINIVVNAATRWKAEELYNADSEEEEEDYEFGGAIKLPTRGSIHLNSFSNPYDKNN